jgi:hypothetical protein
MIKKTDAIVNKRFGFPNSYRRRAVTTMTPAATQDQEKIGSITSVLVLAALFLATAHLAVKDLFPNPVFWVIGASITVALGLIWVGWRRDYAGFLLALFICVHFNFADRQGGFWGYVLVAVLAGGAIFSRSGIKFSSVPAIFNVFIAVFVIMQVIGTALNPYSLTANIQASVVAASQILAFYLCASQRMTTQTLKRFLSVWFLVALWIFFTGINQRYHWINTLSPLLPQRTYSGGIMAHVPAGSFGTGELFGEYFCIIFAFSLIVLSHIKELEALRVRRFFPLIMVFFSLGSVLMSNSRASVVLAFVATLYIACLDFIIKPSTRKIGRFIIISSILAFAVVMVLNFGSYLFIDEMVSDFKSVDTSGLSASSVLSGDAINRGSLFQYGLKRLEEGSWWVGYGYNITENNKLSLGFANFGAKDLHSLYLALPFYYGWAGAVAYVLLLLGTAVRIYLKYLGSAKRAGSYLIPIALGFSLLWGIFLIDQYKIGATRNPNYFLLTWMWLGITHAIANGIRDRFNEAQTKE